MGKQLLIQYNEYYLGLGDGDTEPGGGPLLTVPDESMSIREIFTKYAKTGDIGQTGMMREGIWSDDPNYDSDDLEKLRDSDIVDRDLRRRQINQEIKAYEEELELAKKEKDKLFEQQPTKEPRQDRGDRRTEEPPGKTASEEPERKNVAKGTKKPDA